MGGADIQLVARRRKLRVDGVRAGRSSGQIGPSRITGQTAAKRSIHRLPKPAIKPAIEPAMV
jgi:hypothetical protein